VNVSTLALTATLLALHAPPAASDPGPAGTVRLLLEGVTRPEGEARDAALRPLLDVEGLARFVLDREWSRRTAAEQADFVSLLEALLARRAFPKAASFFGDVTVEYRGVETRPDRTARVVTAVTSADEGTVEVAYGLTLVDQRWRIADVLLDGVSLRVNLRATSQKVLDTQGFAALVARMRRRLAGEGGP
jgi:phospholipid transport system substrate-binding protein